MNCEEKNEFHKYRIAHDPGYPDKEQKNCVLYCTKCGVIKVVSPEGE